MPETEPLRRLGGGRWETRDARFGVEPGDGTWNLVDRSQTNELGLPLTSGPFRTLGDVREAIVRAREAGPAESPLAEQIERQRNEPPPAEPREPRWLRALDSSEKRRARELIDRLEALGIADAEDVARREIAGGEAALAQLALERQLRQAIEGAEDPATAARRTIDAILGGRDEELGASWRLTDVAGRPIRTLAPPD